MEKGTLKGDVTESQKLDFLQYIYGSLMQGIAAQNESVEDRINAFINKKFNRVHFCTNSQLFQRNNFSLGTFPRVVILMTQTLKCNQDTQNAEINN